MVQLHPRILQPTNTALDDIRGDGSGKGVVQKAVAEAVKHMQEIGTEQAVYFKATFRRILRGSATQERGIRRHETEQYQQFDGMQPILKFKLASGWKSCYCLVQSNAGGQEDANGFLNLHSPFIFLPPAGQRESDTNKTLTGRRKLLCRCYGIAHAFSMSVSWAGLP